MKKTLIQLFILDGNGVPSHTKFFSVLGYFMLVVLFPIVVFTGTKVSEELWLIVFTILIGNRSLNKLVELKHSKRSNGE